MFFVFTSFINSYCYIKFSKYLCLVSIMVAPQVSLIFKEVRICTFLKLAKALNSFSLLLCSYILPFTYCSPRSTNFPLANTQMSCCTQMQAICMAANHVSVNQSQSKQQCKQHRPLGWLHNNTGSVLKL